MRHVLRFSIATIALSAIVAGCGGSSSESSTPVTKPPTSTTVPDPPDAPRRPFSLPGPVPAGTHTLWSLEAPVDIELGEGWSTGWVPGDDVAAPINSVALVHPLSKGFVRLTLWRNIDLVIDGNMQPDLRSFVRTLAGVDALQEQEVQLSGRPATRFDFIWAGATRPLIPLQIFGISINTGSYDLVTGIPQHWVVQEHPRWGELLVNWTAEGGDDAEAGELVEPILATMRESDVVQQGAASVELPAGRRVEPEAVVPVGGELAFGVATDDSVVVAAHQSGVLTRIDAATNSVATVAQLLPGLIDVDYTAGALWTADFTADVVRKLDPHTLAEITSIPAGLNPSRLTNTEDAVWSADHRGGTVTRFDPATNQAVGSVLVSGKGRGGPQYMLVDGDDLWVQVPLFDEMTRVDTTTGAVTASVEIQAPCGELQIVDNRLFVGSCDTNRVRVIDTDTNEIVETIDLGTYTPYDAAFVVDGVVWFPTVDAQDVGRLVGIDAETTKVVDVVALDEPPHTAVAAFDSVWTLGQRGTVTRYPIAAFTSS